MATEPTESSSLDRAAAGPKGPHAEAVEVWSRDGAIRLVGWISGLDQPPRDGWHLEIRARERRRPPTLGGRVRGRLRDYLRAAPPVIVHPARVDDAAFEAEISIDTLVPPRPGALDWDLYLVHAALEQRALRVGRWHDGMPGKKRIVKFPGQRPSRHRDTTIRPYFTVGEALSVRSRRGSDA